MGINMDDDKKEEIVQEEASTEFVDTEATIKQVEEIKDAVVETVTETSMTDKVSDLHIMIDNLTDEVDNWKSWHKNEYLEAMESIKAHVGEIENEWDKVAESMKGQREKLETLLDSFPGVIETATLKALSLRVTHLEKLVSQLFQESYAKISASGTRKQLIISLVALSVTVILWIVFIIINLVS
jgi:hypothetical protein